MVDGQGNASRTGGTESIPTSPPPPGSGKRGRRLGTVANVKAALADVYRSLESGAIECGKARALVYTLSVLLQALQANDIETRIRVLEERSPR